mmetsp:Transcript_34776/g.74168  ORF Transcript_34776/g.74168 Transcript_34776/m.74168 type:complete len:202 (+) Transcript_34776:759-1364(+)
MRPLEVVQEGPDKIPLHIDLVYGNCPLHLGEILLQVLDPNCVLNCCLGVVLLHCATILCDDDPSRRTIAMVDPLAELPQTPRHHTPAHVGLGPRRVRMLVHLLVVKIAARFHRVLGTVRVRRHVARRVVVQSEELRGAFQNAALLRGEGREARSAASLHIIRVMALVDGIGKPTKLPIDGTALRRKVVWRVRVRCLPIHVE